MLLCQQCYIESERPHGEPELIRPRGDRGNASGGYSGFNKTKARTNDLLTSLIFGNTVTDKRNDVFREVLVRLGAVLKESPPVVLAQRHDGAISRFHALPTDLAPKVVARNVGRGR